MNTLNELSGIIDDIKDKISDNDYLNMMNLLKKFYESNNAVLSDEPNLDDFQTEEERNNWYRQQYHFLEEKNADLIEEIEELREENTQLDNMVLDLSHQIGMLKHEKNKLKLEKKATGSGADRYSLNGMTIYVPQNMSRENGKPKELFINIV